MSASDADLARPLRLLGMAGFASAAALRWCDSLLPVLAREFSVTAGQSAQTIYGLAIAYGVMQLLYGPLGDRLGKYTVVSFAALACTVGALGSALAPGLGWLTFARILNGAATAGLIPLGMAWVGDNVPFERRQPVLARLLGALVLGGIAGQWLSGVFADTIGWRYGFLSLALVYATAGISMRLGLRDARLARLDAPAPGGDAASSLERMRRVLGDRRARRILAITAGEGAFAFSAMAFATSHLNGRFGIAVSSAGAILALYGVGGILYSRNVAWLLKRMSPLAMARTGGLLGGTSWVLFAFVPGWIWTLPLCLLAGVGFYMIHNTLQNQGTQMSPEQRGTAMSLFACALFSGQSVGTGIAAFVVDWLSTGAVLAACGVGLALLGFLVARIDLSEA